MPFKAADPRDLSTSITGTSLAEPGSVGAAGMLHNASRPDERPKRR
jgi:hypothetical protein